MDLTYLSVNQKSRYKEQNKLDGRVKTKT